MNISALFQFFYNVKRVIDIIYTVYIIGVKSIEPKIQWTKRTPSILIIFEGVWQVLKAAPASDEPLRAGHPIVTADQR